MMSCKGPFSSQIGSGRAQASSSRDPLNNVSKQQSSKQGEEDSSSSYSEVLKGPAPVALKKSFQEFVIHLKEDDKHFFRTPNNLAKQ